MKALLLIDIQYDFLPGGALAVPGGDAILPVVSRLQERFDLVVATQDWHPPGHHSFASSHDGKELFETIDLQGLLPPISVLRPSHSRQLGIHADGADDDLTGRRRVQEDELLAVLHNWNVLL